MDEYKAIVSALAPLEATMFEIHRHVLTNLFLLKALAKLTVRRSLSSPVSRSLSLAGGPGMLSSQLPIHLNLDHTVRAGASRVPLVLTPFGG